MINGHKAVEVVDNDLTRRSMEGIIAIQLHSGAPMGIQIKDIFIKEFPAKTQNQNTHNTDIAGKTLFEEKCAVCHNSGLPGFITMSDIGQFPKERIINTLLHGIMKPQASGLSEKEVKDIAEYLTQQD